MDSEAAGRLTPRLPTIEGDRPWTNRAVDAKSHAVSRHRATIGADSEDAGRLGAIGISDRNPSRNTSCGNGVTGFEPIAGKRFPHNGITFALGSRRTSSPQKSLRRSRAPPQLFLIICLLSKHPVDHRPTHPECRSNRASGFTASVHPLRQSGFRLVECFSLNPWIGDSERSSAGLDEPRLVGDVLAHG